MTHTSAKASWYFGSHHHHTSPVMPVTDLFRPRLIVSSKVFQVVFVHTVYSTLFLAYCCSFSLPVVAKLICIFVISRQLVYFQHFQNVFIPSVARSVHPAVLLKNSNSSEKQQVMQMVFKNSAPTSQRAQCISVTQANRYRNKRCLFYLTNHTNTPVVAKQSGF
jgi:hypothetical protein